MRYRNGWIESVISHIEYNNRFIVSFGKFFAEVYFFAQVVDCLNDWTYNKFMQCIKGGELMEAREELRKLRESTGMNRKEFCEYFEIPYMTETDWELGNRRVPTYLLRLMEYKIRIEQLADKKNQEKTEDKK